MGKNHKIDLKPILKKWESAKKVAAATMANEAKNYFEYAFKRQTWEGAAWKEVKRRTPGTNAYRYPKKRDLGRRTRAILVKRGRLRRSFYIQSTRPTRIVVANSAPYGIYHNEGGKNLPQRQFMGHTRTLQAKQFKLLTRVLDDCFRIT